MSRKGENIYKRKDGRWEGRYIQFYDGKGKAKYGYVYARTYREVKQKLLYKAASISKRPERPAPMALLYGDVLDAWLQSLKINIKESSYARYVHLIERHIRPSLGQYPLYKISTQMVEQFVQTQLTAGRLDKGGPLSPKTVTDILMIVKSTMEYAKYNDMDVICNLSKVSIKKKDKEMRVLSSDEETALIHVLLNQMDLCKFGVLLSLYTGIRIGELCALQWEDFCFSTHTLKIRKTMQRIQNISNETAPKTKVIISEPKSRCSIRDIPLLPFLEDYAKLFAAQPKAYILTGDEQRYIEPRTMQNRFKTYVKESGIKDANFHSLRHTFATRCVEVGFEIKSLSEILGHANVNITLNRYVHSSFDLKCSNMNKLSLLI